MLFLLFERYEQQHYELLCTSFSVVVFLVLEYIPSRGLLSCMVTLCIIFWVIAIFHESIIWSHHNTEEPPPPNMGAMNKSGCYMWSVSCSVVPDFATPWTAAHQAPLSMGFSRQGYWSGLSFPSPGDLPDPGIEPRSPALQAFFTDRAMREAPGCYRHILMFQTTLASWAQHLLTFVKRPVHIKDW